jgi:SAM-dependent methyltransferase
MRHDGHLGRLAEDVASDPIAVDWGSVELPDAWPDRLDLRRPGDAWRFAKGFVGSRRRVELPDDLPGRERIPSYVRQEFHHLPNGFYSKRLTDSYARWFDRIMLGRTVRGRERIATRLAGCRAALDVGCGAGGLAGALHVAGVPDVWGIDPSPYLLQIAARRFPEVRFVQGIIEESALPTARFDGVGACFLFHELPPRVADAGLAEIRRVLAPGGMLVLAEPSPLQFGIGELGRFLARHGGPGIYFALIARWMYEPFVEQWHGRDVAGWLAGQGFDLVEDDTGVPMRFITARRY